MIKGLCLIVLLLLTGCQSAFADDFQIIASVIAAEACSEGQEGMNLIAEVISNRAKKWHKTPLEVVTAKNQFYGYTAPNRPKLYAQCQLEADLAATRLLAGSTGQITGGAIYYLLPGESLRSWHDKKTITYKNHSFYKERN